MKSDLATIRARLRQARSRVDQRTGQARALANTGRQLHAELTEIRRSIQVHEQTSTLLTSIGEQRQARAHEQIEALVTQGLQTIFGHDLSFHLVPAVRAKTPVIDFVIRSRIDDVPVDTDVMEARGGGLAAVVGFLLRVIVLLLSAEHRETVLILDETFAHVSAEYEPKVAEFLRQLVDATGIQIVLVTHSEAYNEVADIRHRLELRHGLTVATST